MIIKTYTVKFPKLRKRTARKVLAVLLFGIPSAAAFIVNSEGYWILASISLVFLAIWHSKLSYERENPEPYFDENISICPNNIIIGNRTIPVKALKDLKVIINDFDGQVIHMGRGKRILNGTDNWISISFGKEKINTRFYISSNEARQAFRSVFENWYLKGVRFYEGNTAGKTYLMAHLNYHQIQEFKKRYNLSKN